jgi:hypothetical protein
MPFAFSFDQRSSRFRKVQRPFLIEGLSALVLLSANETHELKTLEAIQCVGYFLLEL